MSRLIGLILIAVAIWFVLESLLQGLRRLGGESAQGGRRAVPPRPPASSAPEVAVETLVRCSSCGVHVPRPRTLAGAPSEAVEAPGFLCERCRSGAS